MKLAGQQLDERALIGSALRNLKPAHREQVRWTLVRKAFSVGSTVAYALCREFNLDPDEKVYP